MPQIRFADIAWPAASRYWLANARIPACLLGGAAPEPVDAEGVVKADLLVENGTLARIVPPSRDHDGEVADLGGRQVRAGRPAGVFRAVGGSGVTDGAGGRLAAC